MSNLDETLEREFQEKCKKRVAQESTKELSVLRDHFAGLAMQGIAYKFISQEELLAELSYEMADAMLKQRSLTNG